AILAGALAAAWWLPRVQAVDSAGVALRLSGLTAAAIQAAPPATTFTVTIPPSGLGGNGTIQATAAPAPAPATGAPTGPAAPGISAVAGDTPAAARFRVAAGGVGAAVHAAPADPPLAAPVLPGRPPATTVAARMGSVIRMPGGAAWFAADPLEPIIAAPAFPQP